MKKILLIGAFALFGAMNAQTAKGTWMFSGKTELSFNSTTTKLEYDGNEMLEAKTNTFTFSPSAQYFVIDNLAVGLGLQFVSQKTDDDKSNTFTVMPQATYFFPAAGNIRPYVEAGVGYASNLTTDGDDDIKSGGLAYSGGVGVAYFINSNVAFNLGLNYTGAKLSYSEDSKFKTNVSNFGAGVGISVFFK